MNELLKVKEYKAKYEVRIKTKNSRGEPMWITLGNRSDDFEEIVAQLNSILAQWGSQLPPLGFTFELPKELKEFVYVCPTCKTEIPAGELEEEKVKLYCPKCKDWR